MGLADSYRAKLNLYHVHGSCNRVGMSLSGFVFYFSSRLSSPVLFGSGTASTLTSAAMETSSMSTASTKVPRSFPVCLTPMDEACQGFKLDDFFNEIPYLGAFLGVVPNVLMVAALECGVDSWLRSSRARETDELQGASFLQDGLPSGIQGNIAFIPSWFDPFME